MESYTFLLITLSTCIYFFKFSLKQLFYIFLISKLLNKYFKIVTYQNLLTSDDFFLENGEVFVYNSEKQNTVFMQIINLNLLSMDKENTLIVIEEHIL